MILLIAALAMFVDHVGVLFFPQYPYFRFIGMIALPLFAYQCAISVTKTHSLDRYFSRLFVCALFFDVPYWLLSGFQGHNVFYVFAFAVLVILFYEKSIYLGLLSYLFLSAAAYIMRVDYALFGITLVLLFYVTRNYFILSVFGFLGVIVFTAILENNPIYFYSFASVLILYLINPYKRISLGRYFYYLFYPAHLLGLVLVKKIAYTNFSGGLKW